MEVHISDGCNMALNVDDFINVIHFTFYLYKLINVVHFSLELYKLIKEIYFTLYLFKFINVIHFSLYFDELINVTLNNLHYMASHVNALWPRPGYTSRPLSLGGNGTSWVQN